MQQRPRGTAAVEGLNAGDTLLATSASVAVISGAMLVAAIWLAGKWFGRW